MASLEGFVKSLSPVAAALGVFDEHSSTYDPLSAFTPEQQKSVLALQSLASTGTGGGITLGEGFKGPLGEFQQTAGEKQALGQLQGLFSGQDISQARDVFSQAAQTKFNPDDPSSGFAAFSRALAKQGKASEDVLNREAAATGSRFGTAIAGEKTNLASNLADQRGQFLAQLFNQSEGRKMQGAQGLQDLVTQQAGLSLQLQNQAAIERQLKDQEARAKLSEFKRTRAEELDRIELMQQQLNNPLAPITTTEPSLFNKLLPSLGQAAGTAAGAYFGGPAGAAAGSKFGEVIGSSFAEQGSQNNLSNLYSQQQRKPFNSSNIDFSQFGGF